MTRTKPKVPKGPVLKPLEDRRPCVACGIVGSATAIFHTRGRVCQECHDIHRRTARKGRERKI